MIGFDYSDLAAQYERRHAGEDDYNARHDEAYTEALRTLTKSADHALYFVSDYGTDIEAEFFHKLACFVSLGGTDEQIAAAARAALHKMRDHYANLNAER